MKNITTDYKELYESSVELLEFYKDLVDHLGWELKTLKEQYKESVKFNSLLKQATGTNEKQVQITAQNLFS